MAPPDRRIAVIGLGYVGLPVAIAFANRFSHVIGYDRDAGKVAQLRRGHDPAEAVSPNELNSSSIELTDDPTALHEADFYVVTVPTPIDAYRRPDLSLLQDASRALGPMLSHGDLVVYESTVYPGVTESVCGPILEQSSGLRSGTDFKLGYSPERINPGDPAHRFDKITKVVAGQDAEALDAIAEVYGTVVGAGVYRASSIQVAEASKVIENVQRDLNIALMNELAVVLNRLELDTTEVLDAAATKWNFHRFHPGLVGGHCIGVDPYYLTAKAQEVGVEPRVILAGRGTNDAMGKYIAQQTIKEMVLADRPIRGARVAILGLSFKEGVPDVRNSKVIDIVRELNSYGIETLVHDPIADLAAVREHYRLELQRPDQLTSVDATIFAVPHPGLCDLALRLAGAGCPVLVDVRAKIPRDRVPPAVRLWRL